jgi:6-phosphogluconolactonase (cycloisomerase 2 family)
MLKWRMFPCLLVVCISLSCGGRSGPPSVPDSSGEILYVVNNGAIATYSIDINSLAATPVESPAVLVPPPSSLLQFDPSPDDHFVYAVWSDSQNLQHLSVFQTDSSGVPQLPAIQVLNANSLSQFNMHPSGRFAYMLEVTSSNNQYQADIRLFRVAATGGMLKENRQVQGSYGPAFYWPAFLYGFSPDGNKLYDTSTYATGSVYRQRPINLTTGALGADNQLLSVSTDVGVVIGKVIIGQYRSDTSTSQSYVDIYSNTPNPKHSMIHCTFTMLHFCGTATNVQLDKSGHYLFLTDPAMQAVHVAAINLPGRRLSNIGSSMPMTSQTPGFAFSPDGRIVYAMLASDSSVHFYHFDRASGSLSEGGAPLAVTQASGICPARHQ